MLPPPPPLLPGSRVGAGLVVLVDTGAPRETSMLTEEPSGTEVPPPGRVATTWPAGEFEVTSCTDTSSPIPCSVETAVERSRPVTSGTCSVARRWPTTSSIAVPGGRSVPGTGSWPTTWPTSLGSSVSRTFGTGVRTRPACSAARRARGGRP